MAEIQKVEENVSDQPGYKVDSLEPSNLGYHSILMTNWMQDSSFLHRLHSHLGLLCMLIASVMAGLMGVCVNYLKDDVGPIEIATIRFGLMFSIVLPIVIFKNIQVLASRETLKFLVLRSIFGTTNVALKYFAYQNMRMADATAICFGSMAVVGIFGRIFFKEPFHIIECVTVFMTICGVLIVSQPSFLFHGNDVENSLAGIVAALASMILAACSILTMRALGRRSIDPFLTVFYLSLFGSILLSVFSMAIGEWTLPQCGLVRYLIVTIGVLAFGTQALMTYSLSVENAVFISVFKSNELIIAFLLQFLILGISPSLLSGIGSALILTSTLLLSFKKVRQHRQTSKQERLQEMPIFLESKH